MQRLKIFAAHKNWRSLHFLLQDIYQRFLDGDESVGSIPKEEDPFWEPTEDVLIGSANVFLQSLGYALDFDDKLTITDYKGGEEGSIFVNVTPCNKSGKALDEDYFVDNPEELIGKPYHFKVSCSQIWKKLICWDSGDWTM